MLKLEVGKSYVTKGFNVVTITRLEAYGFVGSVSGADRCWVYRDDGSIPGYEAHYDSIIAEVVPGGDFYDTCKKEPGVILPLQDQHDPGGGHVTEPPKYERKPYAPLHTVAFPSDLTRRELFAALAMQGFVSRGEMLHDAIVSRSVNIADKLIRALDSTEVDTPMGYCPNDPA